MLLTEGFSSHYKSNQYDKQGFRYDQNNGNFIVGWRLKGRTVGRFSLAQQDSRIWNLCWFVVHILTSRKVVKCPGQVGKQSTFGIDSKCCGTNIILLIRLRNIKVNTISFRYEDQPVPMTIKISRFWWKTTTRRIRKGMIFHWKGCL
jgi:hypothetical protein